MRLKLDPASLSSSIFIRPAGPQPRVLDQIMHSGVIEKLQLWCAGALVGADTAWALAMNLRSDAIPEAKELVKVCPQLLATLQFVF